MHSSTGLADGSVISIYLETPASSTPHMVFEAHGSGAFTFEVLEAPTVTSGTGTTQSVINKRRTGTPPASGVQDNQGSPASGSVSTDVTLTAEGTSIFHSEIAGGHKVGGSADFDREFILKESTAYVFRFTSREASNRCYMDLNWYE